MYRKLSKMFISTVSIFSLGVATSSVLAIESKSESQNSQRSISKIVVASEDELIEALKDQNITEIVIEGDVVISKRIDLTSSTRNLKITIGSSKVLDSSLVVVQGTKINGGGKLTIVKANDENRQAISFKKVMSTSGSPQTLFQNLTFSGNNNEIFMDNIVDNLSIKNVDIENLTLFKDIKKDDQILAQVRFMNSSIDPYQKHHIDISQKDITENTTFISLKAKVDSNLSVNDIVVAAVDDSGKIIVAQNVNSDRLGNVQASIENLKEGTEYSIYLAIPNDKDNKNFFISSPFKISTLNFKSSVESQTYDGAKIRISKNALDPKYYPLWIILKYQGASFKEVQIPEQTTSGNIVLNITGLVDDKNYEYEIVSYVDGDSPKVIDKGEIKTSKNYFASSDGNVSGSIVSSSSTSNSRIFSFSISDDDLRKSNIGDTYASIYLNGNLRNYIEDGVNFKTSLNGVYVKFANGILLIDRLIPGKTYSGLKVYFETSDGRNFILSLPEFSTNKETKNINRFVKSVYSNAFNRLPDEQGFWYWVDKLSFKDIRAEEFVINLLNESEFISNRTTTVSKIEGLYKVIVNRDSDEEGLNFWIKSYDYLISEGYPERFALKMTVNDMVNEREFQSIIAGLN